MHQLEFFLFIWLQQDKEVGFTLTGWQAIVGRAWPSFVAILQGTNKSTSRVPQHYPPHPLCQAMQ